MHVTARDGMKVTMDGAERNVLTGRGAAAATEATRAVLRETMKLHMKHIFDAMYATDGSKSAQKDDDGRWRKRVAAGVYGGVRWDERRRWEGETDSQCERRRTGMAMWGARLPPTMDVMDTERYMRYCWH